jgi:hypothetical protein
MERIVATVLVVWLAINALAVLFMIGKPRKPLTHGQAVFSLVISIGMMTGVGYLGGMLFQ